MRLYMGRKKEKIYLAGGCFWGVEAYFKRVSGVINTRVGYANGKTEDTSYYRLNESDHAETVEVTYDAYHLSLQEVLAHYFRLVDPTSVNKQGNDVGRQYRTGIYYPKDMEAGKIEIIKKALDRLEDKIGEKVAIELAPLENFVEAEEDHQDYLDKHPMGYCHVNLGLADVPLDPVSAGFEKPSRKELKKALSPEAFEITQNQGTDAPFAHPYNELDEPGIYVDVVSGEPLFSSKDKFDGGCGWPSFSKPIRSQNVDYHKDSSLFTGDRIEVRSKGADSHLGHVFDDGREDMGNLRYCIDGSALRFIPLSKMEEEGYGDYIGDVEED